MTKKTLSYAQWSSVSAAISIANALLGTKIETYAKEGWNYEMYTRWQEEVNEARETMQKLVPVIDWDNCDNIEKLEVA